MDRATFDFEMGRVFDGFQRPAPRPGAMDEIFYQISMLGGEDDHLGNAFISWAAERLRDEEKLPANVGRHMRLVLYPEWLKAVAEAKGTDAGSGDLVCAECGGSGWHQVWRPDAKPGDGPVAVPCTCNQIVELQFRGAEAVRKWTKAGLLDAGWLLSRPRRAVASPPIGRAEARARAEADAGPQAFRPKPPASAPLQDIDYSFPGPF